MDITTLAQKIKDYATEQGACHVGFADLTQAWEKIPDSFEECKELMPLLTGISIGVKEDVEMLMQLPQTDNEYRTKHYAEKILSAINIADKITEL